MSDNASFYPSRPVLRVDGEEKPALGTAGLVSLLVEETTIGLFRCEARFLNWGPTSGGTADYLLFDRETLDFGKTLSVELGQPGKSKAVFAGRITALEAIYPPQRPPELTVLAEDRLQDLRMTRRTRSFENITDSDLFKRIASDHGLTPQIDATGPTHRALAQINRSDLAFVRERAAAIDAEVWIDDKTLYVQARSKRSSGELTLTYGQNLIEFSVLADLAHQRTSVSVGGWDVGGKQAIKEEATDSAIAAELAGLRGGSATLAQALATRKETVVTSVPQSAGEAKAIAEAEYRARARRFVTGSGIADGDPNLRVGTRVDLRGLGPLFEGKYFVAAARHTFDMRYGYRTAFEVERPGIG